MDACHGWDKIKNNTNLDPREWKLEKQINFEVDHCILDISNLLDIAFVLYVSIISLYKILQILLTSLLHVTKFKMERRILVSRVVPKNLYYHHLTNSKMNEKLYVYLKMRSNLKNIIFILAAVVLWQEDHFHLLESKKKIIYFGYSCVVTKIPFLYAGIYVGCISISKRS